MGMAKRKFSKTEPSEMVFTFQLPGGQATSYIDLPQCMSIVNRRFYRQGINVAVADFKLITTDGVTGGITASRVPHTWVAANAWKKAFNAWNKQQKEALAESGGQSAAAKFRDFKVYLDTDHVAAGYAGNLVPTDILGNPATLGEWEPSQIVIPAGTGAGGTTVERALHMVGVNFNGSNSRGIIEGYADSRAYPNSPDPVSPDLSGTANWLARMFDVGETFDDVLENATDKNDNLPYSQVNYPGGENNLATVQYHDSAFITATTVGGMTHMTGGQFYCGLIRMDHNFTIPQGGSVFLKLTLVPGNHRGYLCEGMGDV